MWALGYPDAARSDAEQALREAREIGHAATLMFALALTSMTRTLIGDYAAVNAQLDEVIALANKKGGLLWKAFGIVFQGDVLALTGKASDAIQMIASGISAVRSTGSTLWIPLHLSYLTRAYAQTNIEEARCSIDEALTLIEMTEDRWCEAEVTRVAGEIALQSRTPPMALYCACPDARFT